MDATSQQIAEILGYNRLLPLVALGLFVATLSGVFIQPIVGKRRERLLWLIAFGAASISVWGHAEVRNIEITQITNQITKMHQTGKEIRSHAKIINGTVHVSAATSPGANPPNIQPPSPTIPSPLAISTRSFEVTKSQWDQILKVIENPANDQTENPGTR
jgi:hypothetical protein